MIIGIDAGGTNIRLAIANRRAPLASAEILLAGAADDGGPEPLTALLSSARFDSNGVVSVVAGITKVSRGGIVARWEAMLAEWFPNAVVQVVPDFQIAFHGAVPTGVGVSALAGTGSVMYGENGRGLSARVGGRGWEYGDEGSGAWLTTEAIRRTIRALDGMESVTPLCQTVCERLGESEDAGRLGEAARREIQTLGRGFLVPLLLEQAQAGDPEAVNLFVGAAGWLGAQVKTTLRRLDLDREDAVTIARVGGLWDVGTLLTTPFAQVMQRWYPHSEIIAADASPLIGALRMAEQRAAAR